ncbi:LysR family transcriptional regulator [Gordonia hydrophobica]|uniref:LysR family transcriptional regulator n=1 Tax=Gordonia hydrophobica TaxID=40516 RepID=A0ABZ2U3K1_9ACTN|nr:LysR family transcriptional regulator [Gordonia hydrophobica]MBM7368478.1 DNA-binding transcriptional LysR family regulator [Gordonia hydrophobica]
MDLRQLEYFLAVVDAGGVTRAAADLNVAQPSLSQSVRRLEKSLGTELFHRVGRGLVLAPAGEALVGSAREILRLVERAENLVRDVGAGRSGHIDIAALSDLSSDPLSVWVAKFRHSHPDVRFRIQERDSTADVVELVRSGACELGIVSTTRDLAELTGEHLIDQHFVLVAPAGTEARWADPMPVARLGGVPLVLGEPGTETRDFIERSLRQAGVEPDVAVRVQQRGTVLPVVLAGGGATIVTLRSALDASQRGAVVRDLEPRLLRGLGVIYRTERLTETAAQFLISARESVAEFADGVAERMRDGLTIVEAAEGMRRVGDRRLRDDNQRDLQS